MSNVNDLGSYDIISTFKERDFISIINNEKDKKEEEEN